MIADNDMINFKWTHLLFCLSLAFLASGCQTDSHPPDNLIVNPGFEETNDTVPVGWKLLTTDENTIFQAGVSEVSHSGTQSMMFGRVWAKAWEMNGFETAEPIQVDSNNKYLITFWYKTIGIDEYPLPLVVRLNLNRPDGKRLRYSKNLSTNEDWTKVYWIIDTIPPDASNVNLGFLLWIKTKGKVLIDDVEFRIARQSDIEHFATWRTLPEPEISTEFTDVAFAPSGFMRVEKKDKRWWLVYPDGKPTWAIATMGEIPGTSGNGNVHLAAWFEHNYENDRLEYAKMQYDLLESWGINSFAGWTVEEYSDLTEERYRDGKNWFPVYRVLNFSIMGADKEYYAKNNKGELKGVYDHSFPDPYNPVWRKEAREKAIGSIEKYKGKPWFAGWFMDNEIDYSSLYEYIWGDYSSREFIKYLKNKYKHIDDLNRAWISDFNPYRYASFDEILLKKPAPVEWEDPLYPDFIAFERKMIKEYIEYTCNMVKELDPDHLIISNRLNLDPMMSLYRSIDLWSAYDIVCVNIYPENLFFGFNKGELQILDWIHEKTGRPVIIGEWSIPAFDSGLYDFGEDPFDRRLDWSWPQVVMTQHERAKAYRTCMMQLASKPYMLGAAWFKVLDVNSETRRANRGLIDDDHQPYLDFIDTFRKTNLEINEKLNLAR